MADVHQLPDPDQVERDAADWIARLHADDASDDDQARFVAWRAAHPTHARTYDAMSAAWRTFNATGPVVRAVSFGRSINEVVEPVTARRRWPISAAAAVLAIVGVSLYLWRTFPGTGFQTGIGEHASISLPDGSLVELNSDTRVQVDYTAHARVIRLDRGEAFFKVAHNASRPFWVYGGGSWVRDVGTEFSVYLRPADVRVTVNQGRVEVGSNDLPVMDPFTNDQLRSGHISVLTVDEQADIRDGAAMVRSLPQPEVKRLLSWRSGKVSFDKQPLGDVIAEMSRYTTLKIIVRDEKLRQLMIGGTFPANPQGVETLIAMLHDGFGLRIRREEGRAYIEDGTH